MREKRWNGVSNLDVLCGPWSGEEIVVRERLQTGSFSDRQTAGLFGVRVNVVVAILGYM